ncbi:hypothetical protein FD967_10485 [Polynucleobacter sp. JS-Mosq-20-D10]|uniref:hypothetical protein n=1 Tax=Polynucleobacter sp. JS-Mosq-20-D10 TaxID=2576922 RepID=UPI001BFE37EE|nr:hypothetical protein [Polynucleobacter sp. JS-Mosq-20-D10]QWE00435.1 hypothetical protein FD967_10485 [Polynucleobacter sp. JS-Mosq-20-D10]
MAFLINRNPAARFQCLHSMCKLINNKFNTTSSFRFNEIKFNVNAVNIHSFCDYLTKKANLGIQHCRYKAALDKSGCALTNSIDIDATKSKEVSNTGNSLHGLGLVTRDNKGAVTLTPLGKKFAETDFNSADMHPIIVKAVLSYGPMVGLLGQILQKNTDEFDTSELVVGYPITEEKVTYNGSRITISSGSEQDSNTRTRSCLIAWGISAGFFKPVDFPAYSAKNAHIDSAPYILAKKRGKRMFKVLDIPKITQNNFCVKRTLDYNNLTKNSKALRENNQAEVREATMQSTAVIQNRRFAILYLLNNAFKKSQTVSIDALVDFLKGNPDLYVLNLAELKKVVLIEIQIANSAGIIVERSGQVLRPMNEIDLNELSLGAPAALLADINARLK